MVSKCANPNCFATFHYLHEGKLFVLDEHRSGPLRAVRPCCYWLCSDCSRTLAVVFDAHYGTRLVFSDAAPRPQSLYEAFTSGPNTKNGPAVTNEGMQTTDRLRHRISAPH
jgi:hypothetical protein